MTRAAEPPGAPDPGAPFEELRVGGPPAAGLVPDDAAALYAWCRRCDDAVDVPRRDARPRRRPLAELRRRAGRAIYARRPARAEPVLAGVSGRRPAARDPARYARRAGRRHGHGRGQGPLPHLRRAAAVLLPGGGDGRADDGARHGGARSRRRCAGPPTSASPCSSPTSVGTWPRTRRGIGSTCRLSCWKPVAGPAIRTATAAAPWPSSCGGRTTSIGRADGGLPALPVRCAIAIRAARLIYADIGRRHRAPPVRRARGSRGGLAPSQGSGWPLRGAVRRSVGARRPGIRPGRIEASRVGDRVHYPVVAVPAVLDRGNAPDERAGHLPGSHPPVRARRLAGLQRLGRAHAGPLSRHRRLRVGGTSRVRAAACRGVAGAGGAAIFTLAIAVDTIGHRTIYKEALRGGEALVHHIIIVRGYRQLRVAVRRLRRTARRYAVPALVLTVLSFHLQPDRRGDALAAVPGRRIGRRRDVESRLHLHRTRHDDGRLVALVLARLRRRSPRRWRPCGGMLGAGSGISVKRRPRRRRLMATMLSAGCDAGRWTGGMRWPPRCPASPSGPIARARPRPTRTRPAASTSAESTSRASAEGEARRSGRAALAGGEPGRRGADPRQAVRPRVIGEIESTLLRLEQQHPDYDHAAAARALGQLYWKAPALISVGSSRKAAQLLSLGAGPGPGISGQPGDGGGLLRRQRRLCAGATAGAGRSSAAPIWPPSASTPPSGDSWPIRPSARCR